VDLFTGSTVVARYAKTLGYRVVANDWEPYSYEIARGTVAVNHVPPFARLGGVERVFAHLNSLTPLYGYVAKHFCPQDDEHPDPEYERMFFTRHNGERIDAIREQIAEWEMESKLSLDERAFLLSALAYAVSYASNTSGVFKGFHNGWGGKTGTALYRIRGTLSLAPPVVLDNAQNNIAIREDAQAISSHLSHLIGQRPDIVYIDPPYNQHPYGSNYHLLNTVVLVLQRRFL
jgi:adenine-specific DNA-methyltransferase